MLKFLEIMPIYIIYHIRGVFMSNFSVNLNGVYNYNTHKVYSYLGLRPASDATLKEAFQTFDIKATGDENDLKDLNTAMYKQYTNQVQNQIENQNNQQVVPWASLCQKIGVQVTGDYNTDYAAFNNAIQLLSQSAMDGQAMTYFASIKSEAATVFGLSNKPTDALQAMSYRNYQAQFLL